MSAQEQPYCEVNGTKYTIRMFTCLVACPALRTRDIALCTKFIFWLFSFRMTEAHTQRAGITLTLSRLDGGTKFSRSDISIGAFWESSSHTVSQLKCSRAGLLFNLSIESCLSEQMCTTSLFRITWPSFWTISGLRELLLTAAFAIDLRFPRPMYWPSFFKECVNRWYLDSFE